MKGHFLENNHRDANQHDNMESFRCCGCGGLMKNEPVFDFVEN
jgi:hypothetical protein